VEAELRTWPTQGYPSIICLLLLSLCAANAQTTAPSQTSALTEQQKSDFRVQMLNKPVQSPGCFEAKISDTDWKPTACKTPTKAPHLLAITKSITTNVGDGNDYFAVVDGTISSATGSFDKVNGVSAVYSPIYGGPPKTVYANMYSLQLNTNTFASPKCGGVSGCAWAQFIFDPVECENRTPCVFIEYWLFNSQADCPDGWTSHTDPSGQTANGCFIDTDGTPVANPTAAELGKIKLIGTANFGGYDEAILQTADGALHKAVYAANALDLSKHWTSAEFNLFGECCAYEAFFNAGSKLTVRLSTTSSSPPKCLGPKEFSGNTAETNNLSLTGSCSAASGASPAILFDESGGGDPTQSRYTIGHLP
jgi:hypothetical protein